MILFYILHFSLKFITKPILSDYFDKDLLLYCNDSSLVLIDTVEKIILWKTKIPKLKLISFSIPIVAVSKHFIYKINAPNGIIISQVPHSFHNISSIYLYKEVLGLNDQNQTFIIGNQTNLNLRKISRNKFVKRFKCDLSVNNRCVDPDIENLTEHINIIEKKFTSSLHPTIIYNETFFDAFYNETNILHFEQPLFGSTVISALSSRKILLENSSHMIVFDLTDQVILKTFEDHALSVSSFDKQTYIKTSQGYFLLNSSTLTLDPYYGKISNSSINNNSIFYENSLLFVFPSDCEVKCSESLLGNTIFAAQCGPNLSTVLLTSNGKTKHPSFTINSQLLTCFIDINHAAVTYLRSVKRTPMISIF